MKSRTPATLFLVLLFAGSLAWLLSLDWQTRLSTDVMELIPDRSPSPELALGQSVLNEVYADRVMIALRSVDDQRSVDAYVGVLEASPLVERVTRLTGDDAFVRVGQFVFAQRFALLFPQWLEAQGATLPSRSASVSELAGKVVTNLEAALDDPGFAAFEELVPGDPLLLMRDAAEAFQTAQPSEARQAQAHLLELNLAVSALKPAGQQPVFDLLAEARAAAAVYSPEIVALDTGAHRYAAETEQKMRQEVRTLNLSTVLVVFVICALLCRRVSMVFHVFAILALSLSAGLALTTLFFQQVHVFALIFGCVLCGVIVDYGLHAYLHDAGRGRRSLKTFLKPFLISCGSTLIGFSILLFSDLPVLRQMGLLVVCGLAMAVVVTLVYVFGLLRGAPQAPPFSAKPSASQRRLWPFYIVVPALLLALPFVSWEDDIRNLKYPLPHLDAVDAEIRSLHGGERRMLLTVGEDFASSRERLEALVDWLEGRGADASEQLSARPWVPTAATYREAGRFIAAHPDFDEVVVQALDAGGYEVAAFAPFREAWDAALREWPAYEDLVADFSGALAGGLSGIVGSDGDLHWWVTLVDASVPLGPIPGELSTLRLSQIESMSSVLSSYRERTLGLSLLGGAAMCVILIVGFGLKKGGRIALLPGLAVVCAVLAIAAWAGALNLFHLIGFFLGACLVLDYAVFGWIGFQRERQVPFSVLVSGCTTVASFFILSWSRIPAIHALGLAVGMVTLFGALGTYFLIPRLAWEKGPKNAP